MPPPPDPKMLVMQNEAFFALFQAHVKSGIVKEAHAFLDGDRGYFISGDVSPEALQEAIASWYPYITFEIHQTVKFPKPIENSIKVAKQRAAMMI
ncbi:MAG: hypothetical protein WAN87_03770 [Thermoplasmata archaeon]